MQLFRHFVRLVPTERAETTRLLSRLSSLPSYGADPTQLSEPPSSLCVVDGCVLYGMAIFYAPNLILFYENKLTCFLCVLRLFCISVTGIS
jgi:hypothetical protein